MAKIDYIRMASNKAKGARPYFLEDKAVERVLNITMAVAGEVAVLRERLDTIERLLASKGILSNAEIEAFVPTDGEAELKRGKNFKRSIFHAFCASFSKRSRRCNSRPKIICRWKKWRRFWAEHDFIYVLIEFQISDSKFQVGFLEFGI